MNNKNDKSFKSTGDLNASKDFKLLDLDLGLDIDLKLNLGLKEEKPEHKKKGKNIISSIGNESFNHHEFELENCPKLDKKSKLEHETTSPGLIPHDHALNNDFQFNEIKRLVHDHKNSIVMESSSSVSSAINMEGEKSNHIKFNSKEIKKLQHQKPKLSNNNATLESTVAPIDRKSSVKSNKSIKQNQNLNDFLVRKTSTKQSTGSTGSLLRRSSTKRSVNDYSKTVQDCIHQLAPVLENFDAQFSPSKETMKNEIQLERNDSLRSRTSSPKNNSRLTIDTKLSPRAKSSTVKSSQDITFNRKKMELTPGAISAPTKMSMIDNESFKFIEDMDSDSLLKASKIPKPVNTSLLEGPLTIYVGNQEVTHYDYKSSTRSSTVVASQPASHYDNKSTTYKSHLESTVVASQAAEEEIQSSAPSTKSKKKNSVNKGKRKPASLLPRNASLRVLKDQYPKEKINEEDGIYAAQCVEISGKKSIKSQRFSNIQTLNDLSKMKKNNKTMDAKTEKKLEGSKTDRIKTKKYQSVPMTTTPKPVNLQENNKTKSLDGGKNLQFSHRTSSLINPTSVPSPLLFNKKVLKAKQEGLPPRKRLTPRRSSSLNLSSKSSSPRLYNLLNKEQLMAKQSWETKDDDTSSTSNKHSSHRTRSRSFGPGDLSKYYMIALANVMANNGSFNMSDTSSGNKSNQEILKELNESGVISFRRNSADQYAGKDITSPIFAKINGLTNLEFIELYLDIVQRNLSLDELLQRINQ